MRALPALSLALLLAANCGPIRAIPHADFPLGTQRAIASELSATRLAVRAYVITHARPFPANSLVVETADGTLVLCGSPYHPPATRELLAWLKSYFGPRRLVAINTHFHLDAMGGNQALAEAGVPIHGADLTVRALAALGEKRRSELVELLAGDDALKETLLQLKLVPPDRVFPASEGLVLRFGDEEVRVFYPGPAHAPDNVVVYFPRQELLFGGCMLRTDDRLGNTGDADLMEWPASVRRLTRFPAKLVVPGHGRAFGPDIIQHTLDVLALSGAQR